MDAKFALHNYAGKPVAHYLVQQQVVEEDKVVTVQQVSHHVMIVDRSGSMYSEMEPLKNTLLKLLTLEEYESAEMLVSLISYSSHGDTTIHFERVKVEEVMKPGSKQQEAIRKLQVTGLTCISQGLDVARQLIRPDEITALSLHSDGYANDRSPTAEAKELDRICAELQKMPNVFVNTIAYSQWSDFKFLAKIANQVSGVCVHALGIKQVFDALHSTSDLLAGQVTPAMEALLGDAHYQVFFSAQGMKLNGAAKDMIVRGLKPDDDKTLFKYYRVSPEAYEASAAPVAGADGPQSLRPVLAFARANLSEGNLNTAKYAMVSSRDLTLLKQHARALTNQEIANFSTDLEEVLFMEELDQHEFTEGYGLKTDKPSLLSVLNVLGEHARDLKVDLKDVASIYVRRSLRRVPGTRDENGNLISPWLKTEYIDDGAWAQVQSFDINRNTANINMLVTRKVRLVPTDGGDPITEVAGVDVSTLTNYNNYTIVGDGSLNLGRLKVRIGSKKLFRALAALHMVQGEYEPEADYVLDFTELPLVEFNQEFKSIDGVFPKVAKLKVLSSLLSAGLKDQSEDFTPEQLEELKRHYLSGSLYLNFPTTNEYTDLNEALAQGKVDTRLSYKVDIGDTNILNLSKLHSANKFLDRLFTVTVAGEEAKSPKFDVLWQAGVKFDYKKLSSRTKITAVDDLMKPIFEDFLGLANNGALETILGWCDAAELAAPLKKIALGQISHDEAVEVMTQARRKVERAADQVFEDVVSPLVFYIGATGLLPDEFEARALSADELTAQLPEIAVAKAEQEGTFFRVGDAIITVYVKGEYFTPGDRGGAAPAPTANDAD